MRRLPSVLVLALVAVLFPVAPAGATDATVVLHGLDFPDPDNVNVSGVSCATLAPYSGQSVLTRILRGPDTPPAGTRSWGWDLDSTGDALGSYLTFASASATTTMGLSLYAASGAEGVSYVVYQPTGSTTSYWVGRVSLSEPAGGWRLVDVGDRTFSWQERSLSDGSVLSSGGSATVSAFVGTHGDGPGDVTVGFGCDGNPFYVDAWRIGSPGDLTTVDLEGSTTATTISGSPRTVTAGAPVSLTGHLATTPSGGLFSGAPLRLEAKPYGATSFTEVATTTTGAQGQDATLTVRPRTATTYRWVFDDSDPAEGSTSGTFGVTVHTAVVARVVDATLRRGQRLVVTGRTTPAKPGFTVTLRRKTSSGWVKLASGVVRTDGTYRVSRVLRTAGTYVVRVTVPAGSGNLAGASVRRTARVS